MWRGLALLTLSSIPGVSRIARADDASIDPLVWDAPAECPSDAEVDAMVRARAPRLSAEATRTAHVTRTEAGFVMRLGEGAFLRELTSPQCATLASAAAFLVEGDHALALAEAPSPRPPRPRFRLALSAYPSIVFEPLTAYEPTLLVAFGLGLESIELDASVVVIGLLSERDGGRLHLVTGRLRVGWFFDVQEVELGFRLIVEAGEVGLDVSPGSGLWAAVGPGLEGRWWITSEVGLALYGDITIALARGPTRPGPTPYVVDWTMIAVGLGVVGRFGL